MMRDEEQIRDFLKNSLEPIHAHDSIYTKVMFRLQSTKRKSWNLLFLLRRIVPLTLVLVLMMGILFPVFGKEGTLIDVYNSYRIHQNLNTLNSNNNVTSENAYRDSSIGSYYLSSLLEKNYGIEPGSLLQIKAQNPDDLETVALIVISKLSNKTPEEILNLRKQNMSWGRIVAYYKINPRAVIFHFTTLREKIFDSLERRFFVRGTIESINPLNGVFFITGIPFPIQITIDTEKPQALEAGSLVQVDVVDYGDSQNVQAQQITVLKEEKVGFIILRGEVLERDQNTILLQLRTLQKVRIQLSPRIMELPSQIFLRSGTLVHVEVSLKKNIDGNYVAYRWGKIIPLPRKIQQKVIK
jgi:hypothetical protein